MVFTMAAKRNPSSQNAHNNKVKALAKELKKDGYIVKADIPGYKKPAPIGKDKRIPDIEAQKRGRVKLIEVETKASLSTDRKQQSTFRRSAAQRPNTTFKIETV